MIRRMKGKILLAVLVAVFLKCSSCFAIQAGDLRYYTTRHSIGIEWDIADDGNHNSICQVSYRESGQTAWCEALPLFRVDFNTYNMMSGSIFHLTPGKSYEVNLLLSDPDGGGATESFVVATRTLPSPPVSGRTLFVVTGGGGGSGTRNDPYRGINTAQSQAIPGDTLLLGGGSYLGEYEFTVSGEPGNYIVWKGQGNGKAIIETIRINGSHLWFENLDIEGNSYGIRTYNDPYDVVVVKNRFKGCHYCIYLNHGGTSWFIADNSIIGDVEPSSGDFSGEGIELEHTDGHTVMYNSISHVADGVSYPGKNCDIFGNDIFDVSDDGIEPDYGTANIRVYGNRISNAFHNGISFQPMSGAPWYILRNQVAAPVESALKFRDAVDRALIAHNTFVGWQGAQKSGSEFLLAVQSRNNLWISMTNWYVWENGSGGAPDWRTDLDYDGFDWGDYQYGFKWGERYTSLADFTQATGLEEHGIRVDKGNCFTSLAIPQPPSSMPRQYISLKAGCSAIDKGVVLPNINDTYHGLAPDLGAYEYGQSMPHYGPRLAVPPPPHPPTSTETIPAPFLYLLLHK